MAVINCFQDRLMVVREPCGKLRHANSTERTRILQAYFPVRGRTIHQPKMFEETQLEVKIRLF